MPTLEETLPASADTPLPEGKVKPRNPLLDEVVHWGAAIYPMFEENGGTGPLIVDNANFLSKKDAEYYCTEMQGQRPGQRNYTTGLYIDNIYKEYRLIHPNSPKFTKETLAELRTSYPPYAWLQSIGITRENMDLSSHYNGKYRRPTSRTSAEWEHPIFVLEVNMNNYFNGWSDAYAWPTGKFRHHFLRACSTDSKCVSFFMTEEHARLGRATDMTIGRYLGRYWLASLDEQKLFTAMCQPTDVKFAYTSEEIRLVYRRGPSSCMSHVDEDYACEGHPVEAYGAGDLAVAYIERGDKISARTICRPEKFTYGRIYGDENRLTAAFKAHDQRWRQDISSEDGVGNGARVLRIPQTQHAVKGQVFFKLPYFDYFRVTTREGDKEYFYTTASGDGITGCTNGLANALYCIECEGEPHENMLLTALSLNTSRSVIDHYGDTLGRVCGACWPKVNGVKYAYDNNYGAYKALPTPEQAEAERLRQEERQRLRQQRIEADRLARERLEQRRQEELAQYNRWIERRNAAATGNTVTITLPIPPAPLEIIHTDIEDPEDEDAPDDNGENYEDTDDDF